MDGRCARGYSQYLTRVDGSNLSRRVTSFAPARQFSVLACAAARVTRALTSGRRFERPRRRPRSASAPVSERHSRTHQSARRTGFGLGLGTACSSVRRGAEARAGSRTARTRAFTNSQPFRGSSLTCTETIAVRPSPLACSEQAHWCTRKRILSTAWTAPKVGACVRLCTRTNHLTAEARNEWVSAQAGSAGSGGSAYPVSEGIQQRGGQTKIFAGDHRSDRSLRST